MTDLEQFIQQTPLVDTHEHLPGEESYTADGPDILQDLFHNYVRADLVVAGAPQHAVDRLLDKRDPDVRGRFEGIREAWVRCQHTGYGEAVRLIAERAYGMAEITADALEAAAPRAAEMGRPGARLKLLRDVANLDSVQTDNFCWPCRPDRSGPDFFLYDLSWVAFCNGRVEVEELLKETGIEVTNVASLQAAMEALFEKYAPCAIAVKSQHAYDRTLHWLERGEAEAEAALAKALSGETLYDAERLCLGDWCMARGVELAIRHNLPFKIHTGYYAGYGRMPVERIPAGLLCGMLRRYPEARFVLMHTAYPYCDELVAIAKQYPNVYLDLCWAWSIDPYSTRAFVRRVIHSVPANKLFAFGGDSFVPNASVAYSIQARTWLARTLNDEVADGYVTEKQAIALAERFMRQNQRECFDFDGTRAAIHDRLTVDS